MYHIKLYVLAIQCGHESANLLGKTGMAIVECGNVDMAPATVSPVSE